jgi:glycerol uptake facilitator-like aquaporin
MMGHISGAHLNPVVSLVFIALKKISPIRGFMVRTLWHEDCQLYAYDCDNNECH